MRTQRDITASEKKVQDHLFSSIEKLRKVYGSVDEEERSDLFEGTLAITAVKNVSGRDKGAEVLAENTGLTFRKAIGLVSSLSFRKTPVLLPHGGIKLQNELDEYFETNVLD